MDELRKSLEKALKKVEKTYNKIIFICIGTDRSTGDSYGPIVGSMLKQKINDKNIEIYGTIHEPVHAKNLLYILETIDLKNNLVIAIDACLGETNQVGKIFINNKPIRPGAGMDKNLGCVGDISIRGIVNLYSDFMSFEVVQNTRLSVVYDLAKLTFDIIYRTFKDKLLDEVACTK